MNFLSPLFALAALAVVSPIIFHLVRRRPKEHIEFSSLLFLDPAPPKLTRSSQIDQWLLLLMRSAAVLLVAAAFARPYWDIPVATDSVRSGLQRMILIDTSASMRRSDLLDQAKKRANQWIQKSAPEDIVSVYAFDRELNELFSVSESIDASPGQRGALATASLEAIQPTWYHTDLGKALGLAIDLLQVDKDQESETAATNTEIVVISDLQQGSRIETLAQVQWPKACQVRIENLGNQPGLADNAHATLLQKEADAPVETAEEELRKMAQKNNSPIVRARLVNGQGSKAESFQLRWIDEAGKSIEGNSIPTVVASGRTQLVRIPTLPGNAAALELTGDANSFDNRFYVAARKPVDMQIVCVEATDRPEKESLAFFLSHVPLSTPTHNFTLSIRPPGSSDPWPSSTSAPLWILSSSAQSDDLIAARNHLENKGYLLWVWDRPSDKTTDYASLYESGFATPLGLVTEAKLKDYAMWQKIDFESPLFRDLSDSKFNDFTKVRFWQHRRLELNDSATNWKRIVSFDDGSPALLQRGVDGGLFSIMLSGWQPTESQLALSSKFVPIVSNFVRMALPEDKTRPDYRVGDVLGVPEGATVEAPTPASNLENVDGGIRLSEPGIYRLKMPQGEVIRVAVNLIESECVTHPMDLQRLSQIGVPMSETIEKLPPSESMQRQLRGAELESQQGMWRWILGAVIGLVALESLVCWFRSFKPRQLAP
ncbi:MAG: BatA domain-containing protein [Pirellula sp.]